LMGYGVLEHHVSRSIFALEREPVSLATVMRYKVLTFSNRNLKSLQHISFINTTKRRTTSRASHPNNPIHHPPQYSQKKRCSSLYSVDLHVNKVMHAQRQLTNNELLVQHFEPKVSPFNIKVSVSESIIWEEKRAMNSFPTQTGGILVPRLSTNSQSNIRFVHFLDSRLDGETVVILVRGMDGTSILPIAFETLLVRWPRLCFKTLLMVQDSWFLGSTACIGGWLLAQWSDGKIHGVSEVRRSMGNCLGAANDMTYRQLLRE
jgi:hypothetical protein